MCACVREHNGYELEFDLVSALFAVFFPPVCGQRAQAVLQAVCAVQEGGSPSSDSAGESVLIPPPSPVLRIIIDNMFYPVTLDVLQQVRAFPHRSN